MRQLRRGAHIDADWILLILCFQRFDAEHLGMSGRDRELTDAAERHRMAECCFHFLHRREAGLKPSAPFSHRTSGRSASYSRARNVASDALVTCVSVSVRPLVND